MQLDQPQAQAANSSGHVLVIAGPGSGKTRVLVAKATRLLKETKSTVMIVTFTRKSAAELVKRLKDKVTKYQLRRLQVGTFHALIIKHLEKNNLIGQLVGPEDENNLLQIAYNASKCDYGFESFCDEVEKLHSHVISNVPEHFQRAYDIYLNKLERHKAVDLGRVIKLAIDHMKAGDLQPLQLNEMLVDEFQDIDNQQLDWVLRHAKNGTKITAVGDDDQSIYKFRRAMGYEAFKTLEKELDAQYVRMGTNYRSFGEIVKTAESVIKCNKERIDKIYHAHKGGGGKTNIKIVTSLEAEQDAIIDAVQKKPGDWAVISRTNHRLQELEKRFDAWNIPYISNGKSNFWDVSPAKELIGVLRHIIRSDPISLNNAMLSTGIEHQVIDEWLEFRKSNKNDKLPYEICKTLDKTEIKMLVHLDQILCYSPGLIKENPEKIIKNVAGWLSQFYRGDDEKIKSARDRLFAAMTSLTNLKGDLGKRLRTVTQQNRQESSGGGVHLLTMHSSKGLEFPNVWIMAVEDGVVPNSKLTQCMEEERRLLFVGMTRAEKYRVISAVKSPKSVPSRFLYDAGLLEPEKEKETA